MERSRGFTLLELVVVVAIVAILAAIATQSYARYAFRSHRTDAHHMLMAVAQAQERWHATYNRYAEDLGQLGFADPAVSQHGYYHVVLSIADDAVEGFVAGLVDAAHSSLSEKRLDVIARAKIAAGLESRHVHHANSYVIANGHDRTAVGT